MATGPKGRYEHYRRQDYALNSYHLQIFIILATLFFSPVAILKPAAAGEYHYTDQVLHTDTVWSGKVNISGVVVVAREATLKIEPGTTILFQKVDNNNDAVGDSEIRVLGRLLALGTLDRPIFFKSAEKYPQPKDWSFILIFTSGRKNILQHCRIQHAFSGLQVHFSTAEVTHSTFINNHEGLRFGRARLTIANNLFAENDIGIRFTRMEGPVSLTFNELIKNRIGIFLVPSGQNIQDFFEPKQNGKPWNTGHLLISGNNIYQNSWYDVSLGEKQFWDLDVGENWWGTTREKTIKKKIFDQARDPALGRILLQPIAREAFNKAGPGNFPH